MLNIPCLPDTCYQDAVHYWPLDKLAVRQFKKKRSTLGKIHGPVTVGKAASSSILGFFPLALSLDGQTSWIHLGDYPNSCLNDVSRCPDGVSLSFKAIITGYTSGSLLSTAAISVYHANNNIHFVLRDKEKLWEVKPNCRKFKWQTFGMSWSRENGLTTVIAGDTTTVLRDTTGRNVAPSNTSHTSVTIGQRENTMYAEAKIRDVAVWTEELGEERLSKLHSCNGMF